VAGHRCNIIFIDGKPRCVESESECTNKILIQILNAKLYERSQVHKSISELRRRDRELDREIGDLMVELRWGPRVAYSEYNI